LALKGAKVKGIDLADGPLEVAKIREQKRNLGITYEKIETSKLIKKKEKFDVITCLEMLEHVPDPEKTVKECSELLNNNGDIFFSTINRNLKAFTLAILGAEYILNILPKGTHDYEKLIKPSELLTYIDKSGLHFSEIRGMTYIPFFDIVKLSDDPSVNYIIHARKK
jgi:2-polyprenyl-6-hydroxyphenyl methylase/3-demethylubiquinone-9 3-methyltransferase